MFPLHHQPDSAPVDVVVVVVVVVLVVPFAVIAACAACAAFAAMEAVTVDLLKSATIRKYEATAAIVWQHIMITRNRRDGSGTHVRDGGVCHDEQVEAGDADRRSPDSMQERGHLRASARFAPRDSGNEGQLTFTSRSTGICSRLSV